MLALVTSIVWIISVFLITDWFPTLYQPANSYYFPYLATRYEYASDPQLIFLPRPRTLVVENARGHYSKEYEQLGAQPETFRIDVKLGKTGFREDGPSNPVEIITLGDSYLLVATDKRDSFNKRLETTSGVGTFNTGVAWWGPFQYLEAFRRYGAASGAHVALFCFTEGTDLSDITEYLKWKAGGDYYDQFQIHPDTTVLGRFSFFLRDFINLPKHMKETRMKRPLDFYAKKLIEIDLHGKRVKAIFSSFPDKRAPAEILKDTDGKALAGIFAEFKTLAEERNITPIVVFLPMLAHIYGPMTTQNSGAHWKAIRSEAIGNRSNVENAVKNLAQATGLDFIDLVPPFEAKAKQGELLYHRFDAHWNSQGRQVAAEWVAQRLKELGKIHP